MGQQTNDCDIPQVTITPHKKKLIEESINIKEKTDKLYLISTHTTYIFSIHGVYFN